MTVAAVLLRLYDNNAAAPKCLLLVRELIQQHIILLCVDEIVAYIVFPPFVSKLIILIGFVPMMLLYYPKPTLSIG